MPTSYNGWPASPDLPLRPLVVAGESFIPGILDNDDVFIVLQYVAEQLHERVEPIVRDDFHQADDWGFHYKVSTGDPTVLSCHSSATAFDYNATRHPYGVSTYANFTSAQVAEIRRIVVEAQVIVWGGEWNTPDAMHFEISGDRDDVAAAAHHIRTMKETNMPLNDDDLNKIAQRVRSELDAYQAEQITVEGAGGKKQTLTRAQWERRVFTNSAKAAKA